MTAFTTISAVITFSSLAIMNYNLFDLIIYGIPWVLVNGIWAFYCAGVGGSIFGLYLIICYYLRLRIRQINILIDTLYRSPIFVDMAIIDILNKHNKVCTLIDNYNKFWSKYIFLIFFLYIPNNAFLLYNFIYERLDPIVLTAIILLLTENVIILFLVAFFGGSVSSELNNSYNKLCSLSTTKSSMSKMTKIKV